MALPVISNWVPEDIIDDLEVDFNANKVDLGYNTISTNIEHPIEGDVDLIQHIAGAEFPFLYITLEPFSEHSMRHQTNIAIEVDLRVVFLGILAVEREVKIKDLMNTKIRDIIALVFNKEFRVNITETFVTGYTHSGEVHHPCGIFKVNFTFQFCFTR